MKTHKLVEQDKIIHVLQSELNNNKRNLLAKYKKLKTDKEKNKLLGLVFDDYNRFYNNIIIEKKQQKIAMENILDHLDEAASEGRVQEDNINTLKHERNRIIREIEAIRKDIAEIVQ